MSAPYAVVAGVVDHCGLQLKAHPSSFGAIRECYVRQSMARQTMLALRAAVEPRAAVIHTRQAVSRRYAPRGEPALRAIRVGRYPDNGRYSGVGSTPQLWLSQVD